MFFKRKKLSLHRFDKRRSKLYLAVGAALLFMLSIFFMFSFLNSEGPAIKANTNVKLNQPHPLMEEFSKILQLLDISEPEMQQILGEGCPLVYKPENNLSTIISMDKIVLIGLNYITGLKSSDPLTILKSQLAILTGEDWVLAAQAGDEFLPTEELGEEDFYLDTPPGLEEWHFEMDPAEPVKLSKDPVILLYNTHNAETYKPTDGKSKVEGKNGGVAQVAKTMAENFEGKYGLKTVRSEVIHDYPDWARSYINSMHTAQSLLKANKSIRAVFDIHRDAGFANKSQTTVTINGKKAAKIMVVLGVEHKEWRKNLAFAQKLEDKAEQLYPGLMKNTKLAENRRYNQNLHPNALVLEFGSDLNTLEEAQYSATLFARVVAEVIKGEN